MITRKAALALMRSFVGKKRSQLPWLKGRPKMYDCAAGYSYCATGKVQKYVWVHEMVNLMKANGSWKKGHPLPGDAVIYDWNGDGGCDHVAMFHSVAPNGQWVTFGADQGHPSPGLVSRLQTGKGVILGWGQPFTFEPEPAVPPVLPAEVAVTRHEMVVKPEHYEPVAVVPVAVEAEFKPCGIGSKRSIVKPIQKAVGVVADGVFGPKTEAAVKVWQAKNSLPVTGVVDVVCWKKIVG